MGDTLELFRPLCNGSVRVESRTEKLTVDAGFLLLREALDPLRSHLGGPQPQRYLGIGRLLFSTAKEISEGFTLEQAQLHQAEDGLDPHGRARDELLEGHQQVDAQRDCYVPRFSRIFIPPYSR